MQDEVEVGEMVGGERRGDSVENAPTPPSHVTVSA